MVYMNTQASSNHPQPHRLRKAYRKPGALVLTILIVLIGAVLAASLLLPKGERINAAGYQVVYLTNNQAYFGKLKNTSGEYLVIQSPYAPQNVAQPNQDEAQENAAVANNQTTLLKVRDQVYGPEDSISIKSDQVLFWQNLRDDSKVVQAIKSKQ